MGGCYKISYTEDEAKKMATDLKRASKKVFGNTDRQEKRAYLCRKCKAWHITSISQNDWEIIAKKKQDKKRLKAINKQRQFINSLINTTNEQ